MSDQHPRLTSPLSTFWHFIIKKNILLVFQISFFLVLLEICQILTNMHKRRPTLLLTNKKPYPQRRTPPIPIHISTFKGILYWKNNCILSQKAKYFMLNTTLRIIFENIFLHLHQNRCQHIRTPPLPSYRATPTLL